MNDCLNTGCRGVRPFACGCCAACWGRLPEGVQRDLRRHYRRVWSGRFHPERLIREEVRVIGAAAKALATEPISQEGLL